MRHHLLVIFQCWLWWLLGEWRDELTTDPVKDGQRSLHVRFPEGQLQNQGMVARYNPVEAGDLSSTTTELCASYWVRFESDFDNGSQREKLSGPAYTENGRGHGGDPSRGVGWSARATFFDSSASGSKITLGNYVYYMDMNGNYGDTFGATRVTKGE